MFVHMRCVEMQNLGHNITVYVPGELGFNYIHEGVNVKVMTSQNINKELNRFDILYLHLLNIYPYKKSNGWTIYKYIMNNNIPFVMYVHGNEVQKYGARMFEFNFKVTDFLKWFKKDALVIPKMKNFVKSTMVRDNSAYVFPSRWMKEDLEKNLGLEIKEFHIIPNGIDTSLFKFNEIYKNKFKLLTLRPLSSKKYAVDLAIELMQYLPKSFSLDIYGKGHYAKPYKKLINRLGLQDRVTIKNSFINRKDLNKFFSNYGIFLCPTRMDAQGVSMCEAMASGLLTVSSDNTAIPEFIVNGKNGIVGNDLEAVAKNIISSVQDKSEYTKITSQARASMEDIDISITVSKELDLLRKIAAHNG